MYSYSDYSGIDEQTSMPNATDAVENILKFTKPGGLLIIHVKKIEKETPALIDALKNKAVLLKKLSAQIGDH